MQRLLYLFLVLMLCGCKAGVFYDEGEPVYQTGDQQLWAQKHFDDSNWKDIRDNKGNQIFWVRAKLNLKSLPDQKLGVIVHSFGAFEVYWDGILIGENGLIAKDGKPEVPGTETSCFLIPDSLTKLGIHQVSLRVTQSYEANINRGTDFHLGNYDELLKTPLLMMAFVNLMAGAFLIAAIYYLFLYVNKTKKEHTILIFAIICLMFFALLILEYIKFYVNIPYNRFYLRLELIGWLTFAIAVLVPLYFTIQFKFPKKAWLLCLQFVGLISVYIINFRHYDQTAFLYSTLMWAATMIVVLFSIYRKEKGAVIVLVGLFVSVLIHQYVQDDFGLFLGFTIVILCMLYLHTIRTRLLEEEYESSLLLSSRLKLELIKKNIQPHFLKNTLTSLMDWVEESPKQGAAFIQALAGEFDIMNAIADKELIPIRQEIELCKTHLSVMHFRKEITYTWEDTGIDEEEQIPPALIHTLLENGITHSIPLDGSSIHFKLSYSVNKKYKAYSFQTKAKNRIKVNINSGGGGFGYVKARLTESYQNQWDFTSNEVPDGWLSTIKIFTK